MNVISAEVLEGAPTTAVQARNWDQSPRSGVGFWELSDKLGLLLWWLWQ